MVTGVIFISLIMMGNNMEKIAEPLDENQIVSLFENADCAGQISYIKYQVFILEQMAKIY